MNGQVKMQRESESVQSVKVHIGTGNEKRCSKCGETKALSEFYEDKAGKDGLRGNCKDCQRERTAEWRKANPERQRENLKRWYLQNSEKAKEVSRLWRQENPEWTKKTLRKWYINNREYAKQVSKNRRDADPQRHIEEVKQWRKDNPEKARQYDRISHARMMATPAGRLNSAISHLIGHSLRGSKNGRQWEKLVGYTREQLMKRLEKQFLPEMTWNNYGKNGWHVHHKIPRVAFNFTTPDDIDFKRCWALKNLQPLWAFDNLSKGAKLDKPFQPALAM